MLQRIVIIFILLINAYIFCVDVQSIEKLLPPGQQLVSYEYAGAGLSNNILRCVTTSGNVYMFRYGKQQGSNANFKTACTIAEKAAQLGIAPHLYACDESHECMLMEYITENPWPSYLINPQPHIKTMQVLRILHDALRLYRINPVNSATAYAPFDFLFKSEEALVHNPLMPRQLAIAFDTLREYCRKTAPWFARNGTWYHGDFKKDNVLLVYKDEQWFPLLIDFDTTAWGHPYFDVVKFSYKMEHDQRMALFNAYLDHSATAEEKEQFLLLDSILHMVIAIIRFQHFLNLHEKNPSEPILSQQEMEDLLSSCRPLPSQALISLSDATPKQQQLAAVYALHTFLRETFSIEAHLA